MEALFAVLLVGGLALAVYELGQSHLKRSRCLVKRRKAEAALADGPDFEATAKLFKMRQNGGQAHFSGLALDVGSETLALLCPGPSPVDSYLEGRIDRGTLDEAIHGSLLREAVRAFLRRKLRDLETPTAAAGAALIQAIESHDWSSDLIQRPVRSGRVALSDLVEAEVFADGRSIAKAERRGGGATGDAIIRKVAARRLANKELVGLHLKVLVNDLDEPLYLLDLCDNTRSSRASSMFGASSGFGASSEESLQEALRWLEILRVILTQQRGGSGVRPGRTAIARGRRVTDADPMTVALRAIARA